MTDTIKKQEQALREALPDYLNGHASADQASRIAAKLEQDPAWAADAAWMGDIRSAIEQEAASLDASAGLAELQRRLAQEKPAWWRRLLQRFSLPSLPRLAPLAITALASICIIQAWLLWQVQGTANEQLQWRSVPGTEAPVANLRVQFKPDTSISQMEAALELAHAGIVTGPLPGHIYLLDGLDAAAALQSLKNSGVVDEAALIEAPGAQ
ncbi:MULTISPECIES: hypothetical protein [unclassified Janthinobacterium]|uniref:hypothetical protein n=1 Tax=unclassified Janthinobacterium TaxID=2610881 RepID=UPI0016097276|nr:MULTISPECIES: hypothetical protein [unclassified Janthinobacterium]MBB5610023.1 hypothetical protein [Janthinobacterium sp. S3T4]MBB5615343.1 hypothetical protein [Janthinobacterium sp. S3M3]